MRAARITSWRRQSPQPHANSPSRRPARGRVRVPPPLISRRLPSGRGATEQPNAGGDGDAVLTPLFWAMVALTGAAAGLFGDLLMLILFTVQHLAFGYHSGPLEAAVERASDARRLIVLLAAGAFGGIAWFLLRRYTAAEHSDLDDVVWEGGTSLSFRRSLGTSVISEIVIGMGASIGRENAPKLMGGATASVLAGWARLSPAQRKLLMACGGGAGLAAVYNVPLGGALFTAEIMMGSVSVPVVLPALACSGIATVTGWLYLPDHATYLDVPGYRFTAPLLAWALIAGPVIGLIACGYIRLIGWVTHHQASGRAVVAAPLVAFGILGLIAFAYPQLLGNGKDMAHDAFLGTGGLGLLLALCALKPLVTALCLGSGASGGLFTPTLSTGAVLGGAAGIAWSHAWPGSPAGAYALVGAAAMLGAAMQAPLASLALILELTHGGFPIMIPMIAATVDCHRDRPPHRRLFHLHRTAPRPPGIAPPLGSHPLGGQPLTAQVQYQLLLPGVNRRQGTRDPAEEQIGQAGVAHQGRAVQVGAEDPPGVRTLGSVAVSDAGEHGGQRLDLGAAHGGALMVLETGEALDAQRGIDVGGYLADPSPLPPAAAEVEQPEPRDRLALRPAELRPDDLVAGADREDHRPAASGGRQATARPQPTGGEDLRQVFSAPEQIDVAVHRDPLIGIDLGYLDGDAPQPGPASQHEEVAAVAVRAEQVGVDPDEPDGRRS